MRLGSASTTGESVAQLAERLDGLHEMLYPRKEFVPVVRDGVNQGP